ncbi:uncharacterized protein LOC110251776 [Exaiptasia diaphana]|uniref:Uncharacterized protein n=1 Tax=Exaiptasia diaphana TaxID=2652724 RepID=A0A913Y2Q2_EXADI|nr:uncharacterized protein LOC110251776 [Exaiptasia diaphana]KXJ22777.1 hypothetical protein AC249_AIPGENE26043 [Exaiptasia diaphana]
MISGAYSNKYKAAQDEHVHKLKEQAKKEGQNIKDRVRELSKETNRRRKALENRKKELADEEERNRQAVLSERHKAKQEATQKFQKDYLRKKTRPGSGKQQTDEPQVVEDGIRVVRGHIVAIRNGQQVTVPTLEDALNMVNNPYNENTIVYHGPQHLYNDTHGNDVFVPGPGDDHIKLREDALENGGPMFTFMNGQITQGALPQTMRRNSPSGSLTSLDSLDEVPPDQFPLQEKPPQVPGIIVKEKVKSAGRRRVTFSDSIEFDDGLTGQLVTDEKESCKQYVKQYNSRIAASNTTYSTLKPSVPVGSPSPGKIIVGTPGNTPVKSAEIIHNVPSASSGSMVVPMSVYSQLQFDKPIASSGESTFSSNTHTDRPQQCVAEVEPNSNQSLKDDEQAMTNDSLDSLHDSLEADTSPQQSHQQIEALMDTKQEQTSSDALVDDDNNYDTDYHTINTNIEYYGNPSTIYKNPFGQRNTSKEANQVTHVAKEPEPQYGYAPDLLLESAVDYIAGSVATNMDIYPSNQNNSHINTQPSVVSNTSVYMPTSSYYKSWYPGSFFSSKTVFGDETEQDKMVKKANSIAYDLIDDKHNINHARQRSSNGVNKANSKSTGRVNPLGKPDHSDDINQNEEQTCSPQVKSTKQVNKVIARPPHPSTRHKGVVYSSPLHRKRALASAKRTTGKNSPKSAARRSPTSKSKEPASRNQQTPDKVKEKNNKNQQKGKQVVSTATRGQRYASRGNSSSSDEDDELLQNIQRDMERISMLNNASLAQEEHQKIMNTINLSESPLPTDNPASPKTDFKSVYKKVHKPRAGSATKQRPQLLSSNRGQPSKIPVYLGPSGSNNQAANLDNHKISPAVNHPWTGTLDRTDRQNSDKELVHPQTAALRQSIPLDKTPTDDEINILWDRVRNCLNHKDTQSVGSDSCVNRIDVRRSRTQDSPYMMHNTTRDASLSQSRAASISGLGTMRRYSSQEVLRRYGSADNLGPYRQQPLLQHRAQRTRQSGQGKPPVVPRQQFSPMASRQAPAVTMSTRAGPTPLSQNELRAVMKASQQEIHQTTRTGPSALSIEENKLLQSLDRLNERLKAQEAITANINRRHEQPSSSPVYRAANHQRSSSATYKHR